MLEPLFEPVYLAGVVVGGVEVYGPKEEKLRKLIRPEIERAIWGRLGKLEGKLTDQGDVRLELIV
jgi:hypothetical protein